MAVTDSRVVGRTGRATVPARAVLAASWQAHVVDAGTVHDELNRLWDQIEVEQDREGGGADIQGGMTPEGSPAQLARDGAGRTIGSDRMRANTLNLIAVARSDSDAKRIESAIVHLGDLYPSRAIVLVADPHQIRGGDPGLDVRVGLLEQPAEKGRPVVRFECITIEADTLSAFHLANVASPLLVADLPDFLWWPGDSPGSTPLFHDLTEIADRLIVDSSVLSAPGRDLPVLASLMTGRACPMVSDFAWARLTPWRQLVAQFFDAPAARPCLHCIDDVQIVYGPANRAGASGLSAALLTAGWLATRLGWVTATSRLERTQTGYRLPLRTAPRRGSPGHDVTIHLRSDSNPTFDRGLGLVSFRAVGDAPGTFTVERVNDAGLATTSETPNMPPVSRMVYAVQPDDPDLLGPELHAFGRDRVYEESLAFVASLLAPDMADPGGEAPV